MWSEPTIFVVDDDPAVQDSLRALLESADFRVETFGTGEAFLEAVDGQHGCVVLDIDLPAMDGLAVMRSLIERRAGLPVILMTGRPDQAARVPAGETGVVALLEKPMPETILLDTISSALHGAREDRSRLDRGPRG